MCPLFCGSFRGILVVFLKASNVHVWALQTCTFEGSSASNTTKIPREDPQEEGRKNENCGGRGKQKREILVHPPFGPHPTGPPLFLSFGPPPFGSRNLRAPPPKPTRTLWPNYGLATCGFKKLAKCGQMLAKSVFAKCGFGGILSLDEIDSVS